MQLRFEHPTNQNYVNKIGTLQLKFTQKWQFCYLLTVTLLQTCIGFFFLLLVAIHFHSIIFLTMEVNGYQQLFS